MWQYCWTIGFTPASLPAEDNQPYLSLPCSEHKITSAVWGPLGDFVIAGHENGEINQFSAKVGRNENVAYWLHIQQIWFEELIVVSLPCGTVWRYSKESEGAQQANQRHPNISGSHHVHHCLQGQHCQGSTPRSVFDSDWIPNVSFTERLFFLAVWFQFSGPHQVF